MPKHNSAPHGAKAKNFKSSLFKLIKSMKPCKWSIISALILAAIGTVLSIFGPYIVNKMGKEVLIGIETGFFNFEAITTFGLILVGIYLCSFVFTYVQGFIMSKVSVKLSQNYRSQISKKINKLPLSYFDKNSYGDTLSRITNDVDTVGQTLNNTLSSLITSTIMIVGVPVMMFILSWQMTLVSLLQIPIALILIMIVVKFSQKYFTAQQKGLGKINGHIEEIYSSHNVVKAFNGEKKALETFDNLNGNLRKASRKSMFLSGLMFPILNFVGNLVYIAVCVLGAWITIKNNDIQFIANISSFLIYIRLFNQPLGQLGSISTDLQTSVAAAERVFEFLEEPEEASEEGKFSQLNNIKGEIEFKNVSFSYVPGKEIIHNFSMKAKPGQKIAIVGPTGAGKTTIVNLLMRFYEVDSGDILVDGISTKEMTRETVRSLFGMVLQDTWLFEGTIKENIAYSNSSATDEEIVAACKMANVDHFIRSLPGGYNMVLTESAAISGGQKQLLTIARAMVQNSPMLILDEATSSVDTRTEILIQTAMDRLMENRTSFVIAHRLSTIKNADLILVMKDGEVIEQGNHEELIAKQGFYCDLYNSQFDE